MKSPVSEMKTFKKFIICDIEKINPGKQNPYFGMLQKKRNIETIISNESGINSVAVYIITQVPESNQGRGLGSNQQPPLFLALFGSD